MNSKLDFDKFINRVAKAKKDNVFDLSSDEDLSIAIMNLISIEEHFFFTAKKTDNDKYFDLLKEVREMRKELLAKLIPEYEGEVWCISKHLLASSMRLMEVGTKYLGKGDKTNSKKMFEKSYNLYSLFWGLNLKALPLADIKNLDPDLIDNNDKKKSNSIFTKLGALVKRAVDCCIE